MAKKARFKNHEGKELTIEVGHSACSIWGLERPLHISNRTARQLARWIIKEVPKVE